MASKRQKPKPLYKSPISVIQRIIDFRGTRYRKAHAKHVKSPINPRAKQYQYPTALQETHRKGNTFLERFKTIEFKKRKNNFSVELKTHGMSAVEAKNAVVLIDKTKSTSDRTLARIGIGFEGECVVIEVVQGRKRGETARNVFRSMVKSNWTTYLIERIEETAKESGFKQIKLRRPETLLAYQLQDSKTKEQIRTLYYSIAKAMGFETRWPYFEKKL